jgi:cytochrome oxidase Cu insertion factor (SCO1/SenC/PrrC family)
MRRPGILIAFLVLAAIAIASAFFFYSSGSVSPPPTPGSPQAPAPSSSSTRPMIGGPFALVDGERRPVTDQDFRGRFMLVLFGYTHCPDVCPLTTSNIVVAKKQLPKAEQDELRVVFVTTDPDRDKPAELGKWLKGIDPQFIGLTGGFPTIQAGARTLGISLSPPTKDKNGKTISEHGTQVIAFSPKTDGGYVLYGEDATVDDYTKDLPKIAKGENP